MSISYFFNETLINLKTADYFYLLFIYINVLVNFLNYFILKQLIFLNNHNNSKAYNCKKKT